MMALRSYLLINWDTMLHSFSQSYFCFGMKSMRIRPRLAALLSIVLIHGCTVTSSQKVAHAIPFSEVRNGSLMMSEKRMVVIRDANELSSLWNEGGGSVSHAPNVDFSKHVMLGLFFGVYPVLERPRVSLSSVERQFNPDRIEVTYTTRDWNPEWRGGITLPSMNSLHILALIPRTDLPVNFIEKKVDQHD